MKLFVSILFVLASLTANAQTDSLHSIISNKYDTLKSLVNTPQSEINNYNQQISSLQLRLTNKIDSLNKLPNPDKFLVKSLDSLRGKVDSIKNTGLPADTSKAMSKVNELQERLIKN